MCTSEQVKRNSKTNKDFKQKCTFDPCVIFVFYMQTSETSKCFFDKPDANESNKEQ